jgi:hypothetical protein
MQAVGQVLFLERPDGQLRITGIILHEQDFYDMIGICHDAHHLYFELDA